MARILCFGVPGGPTFPMPLKACCRHKFAQPNFKGVTVCVQQGLNLAPFNARGRANALHSRNFAKRIQTIGRKSFKRILTTFELIDFCDKLEEVLTQR